MVLVNVLSDCLKTINNAESQGKKQVKLNLTFFTPLIIL